MKTLIDSLTPHKLSEDEINEMFSWAAEKQKKEVLPSIYECHKCGEQMREEEVDPKTKQGLCGYCSV